MTIVFIKPKDQKYCIAVFSAQYGNFKLMRVSFKDSVNECAGYINSLGEIERAYFDGTVYCQRGIELREMTEDGGGVWIYKNKDNIHDRIAAQQEWISANMKFDNESMKKDADYSRFVRLMVEYGENRERDTIAAELMADAARCFSRIRE